MLGFDQMLWEHYVIKLIAHVVVAERLGYGCFVNYAEKFAQKAAMLTPSRAA